MSFDADMSDLLAVFLEEAAEQLQKLDDGFLQVEKEPGNIELLKEVFRAAHTLKGSSATMGFAPVAELTHAMESLLDVMRSGELTATPESIDLLLAGTDLLRNMVAQVGAGEQIAPASEELIEALKAACNVSGEKGKGQSSAPSQSSQPAAILGELGDLQIRVKIADECTMPSVRAFMIYNALSGLGEVKASDPPEDKMDDLVAGQEIRIAFSTVESTDAVAAALKCLSEIELLECALPPQNAVVEKKPVPEQPGTAPAGESAARSIQTVRVGVDRLDTLMNLVAELCIDRTRINRIDSELSLKYEGEELVQSLAETAVHIGRVVTELQEHIMKVRLLPVEQVFNRFPRMVRDLAHKAGKEVEFVLEGQDTELDRSILEDIVDPITHLLRNAVDHGVEGPDARVAAGKPRKARVVLAAKQEENRIIIEVEDDGHGISVDKVKAAALKKGAVGEETLSRMSDIDALQLIFASGVSTAEKITDVSGRGVGMDVVRNNIQNLSGSVEVFTEPGKGTKFKINLPLTLAIIQALVTQVGDQVFVVPLAAVGETFRCDRRDVHMLDGHPAINFRGSVLHLLDMAEMFDIQGSQAAEQDWITFVVVRIGSMKVGLMVDKLIGEQEVVIKALGAFFGDIRGIAGATILGDGRVALIVDVSSLGTLINRRRAPRPSPESAAA